MNHRKGSVVGQLVPVEYNRLKKSEIVWIDDPAGGYMEMLEYRISARGHSIAIEDKSVMEGYLLGDDDAMHHPETEGIRDFGIVQNARRNDRAVGEPSMESGSVTILRSRDENHAKDTRSDSNTLRENRATTEVRLVYDWTDSREKRFGRKKKIERGESVLNDECERSDDPKRSSSSVREAERRSLFRSIYDRADFSAIT